jgi:hypothetical protein
MTRDLPAEIRAFLQATEEATALQIARGVEARMDDVLTVIHQDARISPPRKGERGRLYYRAVRVPRRSQRPTGTFPTPGSHCAKLLAALSDGKPHDHRELYGLGIMVHSRIADLRAHGYEVAQWSARENGERLYCYQIVGWPLEPVEEPSSDGSQREATRGSADSSGQLTLGSAA